MWISGDKPYPVGLSPDRSIRRYRSCRNVRHAGSGWRWSCLKPGHANGHPRSTLYVPRRLWFLLPFPDDHGPRRWYRNPLLAGPLTSWHFHCGECLCFHRHSCNCNRHETGRSAGRGVLFPESEVPISGPSRSYLRIRYRPTNAGEAIWEYPGWSFLKRLFWVPCGGVRCKVWSKVLRFGYLLHSLLARESEILRPLYHRPDGLPRYRDCLRQRHRNPDRSGPGR